MNSMEMAYRKMAVGGASGLGLLIALYDTLAGDLRRAADAERANDIEKRCREANHALLVIAHLEDVLSRGVKGELTQQLAAFYSSLRRLGRTLAAAARAALLSVSAWLRSVAATASFTPIRLFSCDASVTVSCCR
jgi:flagellar biosynthetic protein FliS